jgi:hypothetical protein
MDKYMQRRVEDQRARDAQAAALRAAEERAAAAEAKAEALRQKLRTTPLEALQEEGLDFEALTSMAVGGKTPAEVEMRRLQARLDAYEAQGRKAAEEAQARANQEAQERAAAQQVAQYKATQIAPKVKAMAGELKAHRAAVRAALSDDGITVDGAQLDAALVETVYHEMNRHYQVHGEAPEVSAVVAQLEARAKRLKTSLDAEFVTSPAQPTQKPKPAAVNNRTTPSKPASDEPDDLSDEALTRKAIEYGNELIRNAA